jgi:tRNA U34 5-carboxymethylaminomethyl modifying GTPase MnmE/TrmE
MKVTLIDYQNTNRRTVIADHAAGRGPGSMFVVSAPVEFSRGVQVQEFLRGVRVSGLDRGNVRYGISLVVSREFTSIDEALAWGMDHPEDCPAECHVEILTQGGGGQRKRYLKNAVLTGLRMANQGASVTAEYSFVVPEITTTV